MRKFMTVHKALHPRYYIDRLLYVKKKKTKKEDPAALRIA